MRAVISTGDGGVAVAEAAKPTLVHDTDAIVRVQRAAICGTDLGLLRAPSRLPRGTILGHEFVGVVESAGSRVGSALIGSRVVGTDFTACGTCWWCRHADHWHCAQRQFFGTGDVFGRPLAGAQGQFVRVPYADVVLHPVPDGIPDEDAVFLGDTVPTAFAAVHRSGMAPGATVLVIGGGPVGQITSLVAQACGAGHVILSEPDAGRRASARAGGASSTDPARTRALVDQATSARGADVVIDCVGGEIGLTAALDSVRSAGRIVSVGVPHQDSWPLPLRTAFEREVSVSFAIGNAIRDFTRFLPLIESGAVRPSDIVSEVAPLTDAVAAYDRARNLSALKILLSL